MTDKPLDALVICGSLRKGSYNAALARSLPALAPPGLALRAAPTFAGLPVYNFDEHQASGIHPIAQEWAQAIRSADAVIIVSPEYNWSIPGGLKNAIDWVSRLPGQPFAGKPIALQSASPGPLGGARVQYDLRRAMVFLDAFVLNKPEIFIGGCASKFEEKTGAITDEATRNFLKQQLGAFVKFIAQLAPKS